jgi:hypothetical protein
MTSLTEPAGIISSFRRDMNEVFGFLGCHAALESSWVPTFLELLLVPSP